MAQDGDMTLGGIIKSLRARRGIRTQAELAQRAGISPGMVGHIESGTRSVSPENLEAIADALGVSANDRHRLRLARATASDQLATPRRSASSKVATRRRGGDSSLDTKLERLTAVVKRLSDDVEALKSGTGARGRSASR